MNKAIEIDHLRRIASRRASLVAKVASDTFYRWKHGDGDITLTQAAHLAQAKGLHLVFVRKGADMANIDAPAAAPNPAPAPVVPPPANTPPACACVQAWLRAQAALLAPPKPPAWPKAVILRKRYADD